MFITLLKKELVCFFTVPTGYIVIISYWAATGFFFSFNTLFVTALDMVSAFHNMSILLLLVAPIITMRSFPEEYKSGTYELLIASGISVSNLLSVKFIFLLIILLMMIFGSVSSVAVLAIVSEPDLGPIVGGLLGVFFLGSTFMALGLAISTLTDSQIIAAMLTWVLLLFLWFIDYLILLFPGQTVASIFEFMSFSNRYLDLIRGVLDLGAILYFLGLIFLSFFIAQSVLIFKKESGN